MSNLNHPAASKINWTAMMIQIIGLLALLNVIPTEFQKPLTEMTLLIGPALIQVWRTWFTG